MYFRIKEARKAAHLTQRELADRLGIKVSTLSGYEIGAHDPKSNTLSKIADICHTTVDFLLGIDKRPAESGGPSYESRFMELYSRLDAEGRDLFDYYLDLPRDRRHLLVLVAKAFQADTAPPPSPPRSAP